MTKTRHKVSDNPNSLIMVPVIQIRAELLTENCKKKIQVQCCMFNLSATLRIYIRMIERQKTNTNTMGNLVKTYNKPKIAFSFPCIFQA